MSRIVRVAGAQMGPNTKADSRAAILQRMIALLEGAHAQGAELVVFPELALTTFFPRWWYPDEKELEQFYEPAMPNPNVQPLFDRARALKVGFYLGFAEMAEEKDAAGNPARVRYNSAVTVDREGRIAGRYRKVHLPGSTEFRPGLTYQQLEKRYFAYGNLGFPAFRAYGGILGMLICNDRRWPEGWRCYGLQGVELMLIGYNSAAFDPNGGESESAELRTFHSTLAVQANAYMNAMWAVSVAKAGNEDGGGLIGGSCIVGPDGLVKAQCKTLADELIVADCDLDACRQGKTKMFNFAAHRRPQHYSRIVEQVGAIEPPLPATRNAAE